MMVWLLIFTISARRRFINTIKQNKIDNVIVLSGDSHANWVYDGVLPSDFDSYDPATGAGSQFVEFGVTAVSSSSSYGKNKTQAQYDERATALVRHNKNLHYADGGRRGWYKLSIDRSKVVADYYGVNDIFRPDSGVTLLASFEVKDKANKLTRPINQNAKPVSGTIQDQAVDYSKEKWNGTTFV